MRKLFELEAAALAAEDEAIREQIRARQEYERNHCQRCGKSITEWEDVEQKENEIIFSYRCSCGYYADQHYKLIYDRTEEIV